MTARWLGAFAAFYLATSDPALAHSPVAGVGGFLGGLLHPILVPAHVLGLIALGLFVAQRSSDRRISLLAIFAVALAAGLTAISLAVGETPAGDLLLATTALTGLTVAVAWPAPTYGAFLLAAATGAAVALDSPPDAISISEATRMLIGTGSGACLVPAFVVLVASKLRRDWQRIGMRALGSWIAAIAILGLALRLAPA